MTSSLKRPDDAGPANARPRDYVGAVLEVVARIPAGRVMTYGDVAWVFGRPGARAVGMVMARYAGDSPWWRVVRASGLPPASLEAEALAHYEREGTPLIRRPDDYRIDLPRARWDPFADTGD